MEQQDLSRLRIDRAAAPPRRRGRGPWIAALVAIAAVLGGFGYARFGAPAEVETVAVARVFPSQSLAVLNATGYVVAQRKAAVSSKATGRLEWLGVLEGSRVKKGEIIARVESRDVAAAVDQASANVGVAQANLEQGLAELADAESAFKRSEELLAQKYISPSAHDSAIARYHKASAAIVGLRAAIAAASANRRAAQVAFEQTLIRAPFDGVVLTKNANVGDIVTPFSAAVDTKGVVVTMADMETLEVEADVSEASLGKIRVDQACEIQLEAFPDVRFPGVVSRMVPTVDRTKATLLVKVRFTQPDARVLPDMSAKVAFLSRAVTPGERYAVDALQRSAIVARGGRNVVFAVRDGRASEVPVETGRTLGDLLEVKGVAAGDRVVLRPDEHLRDGERVRATKS
ncbi:MAG TPA: efflux RND transporter periplasmic adaptor subunit [Burkholderiales bacterium]|nr:efflux RND transporter periplasmic adaptor subunit [Burkholderiales bacterium]